MNNIRKTQVPCQPFYTDICWKPKEEQTCRPDNGAHRI